MTTPRDAQPASSQAEVYERDLVPAIFSRWVGPLLDLVDPRPGERLLDIACGTGIVARGAQERVGEAGRVVGLDMTPGMIAVARSLGPAIEWREGNALALPFEDRSFDVVVCQQGLQFFPDRGAGVREMHRVLAPGGRVGVAAWGGLETSVAHHALVSSVNRHVSPEAGRVMSLPFGIGDVAILRGLFEAAGFRDVSLRTERRPAQFPSADAFTRGMLSGGTLARLGIQVSSEAVDAVSADVERALIAYEQPDGLVFPVESHLVLART